MGGISGIDMEEYAAAAPQEKKPEPAKEDPKKEADTPLEVLFPYMRKCLDSVVGILTDDSNDISEKTRLLDSHLAALCAIAYHYGKTGEKPDTLEIMDDGTVVPKKKEG